MRLTRLFQKRPREVDLTDELRAYVEELTARKILAGAHPEEARRLALIETGGIEQVKEACRDVRRLSWLDAAAQDLRYGFRTLRRHRIVTIVSLLSLALGIGANSLVFSFVNAMLLRPLPYRDTERLVMVGYSPSDQALQIPRLSRVECEELMEHRAVFEDLGCFTEWWASIASDNSGTIQPERLPGQLFTTEVGRTLGVEPILGRWFNDSEEREGTDRVIVISYGYWQGRFGGSHDVLGRTVRVDGDPFTIIGVMADNFELFNSNAQYWMPLRNPQSNIESTARVQGGVARLTPGVQIHQAQSEMDVLGSRSEQESPEGNRRSRILVRPLGRIYNLNDNRASLLILAGAVIFVLLIACANVAGLLLAQAATQERELAVRSALGSGRWRIIRQSVIHSILLSSIGGMIGLGIGWSGVQVLKAVLPAGLPRHVYTTNLDGTVLLFTIAISVACGVIVGIAPALRVSRAQPLDVLRESGRSATTSIGRQRLRSTFVTIQLALAFMLLVGSGLMLNSLVRLANAPLGFDPNDLLTLRIELPDGKFRRPTNSLSAGELEMEIDPEIRARSEQIRQNLAAIPEVFGASAIGIYPPNSGAINLPVRIDGQPSRDRAQFLPVMPDYFATLQVKVAQGREFRPEDTVANTRVAVVNETMALRYWPNESPLGKYLQFDAPSLPNDPRREIVGVVGDVTQFPGQEARDQVYIPYLQLPLVHDERLTNDLRRLTFVMRTSRRAAELDPAIRTAVERVDSGQAVSEIRTMRETAFNSVRIRRVYVALLAFFGAIAVALAVTGVYGIIAHMIAQRTNEIGIRMALGAAPIDVRRYVMRQGIRLIGTGLIGGLAGTLMTTRVIRASLFGISSTDPITFTLGLVLLGVIGLLACYVPARRASRIDPMVALRHE